RTIDIDIIFYDDIKMQTPALEIPHPRWSGRDFVITPLLDLRDGGEFDSQKFAFVKNFLKDKRRKFEPVKDYERR
ncbi:MAG: 2-amino-4-hydroxy-6-hydroxymethyldihydropteridine diphosphokinase, partial [Opitutales bacterium]|nr:2-amino-4-hydroxy-6-hydroxymethyldihydropteridine diphosphokinase [Opitutales bacterium]